LQNHFQDIRFKKTWTPLEKIVQPRNWKAYDNQEEICTSSQKSLLVLNHSPFHIRHSRFSAALMFVRGGIPRLEKTVIVFSCTKCNCQ